MFAGVMSLGAQDYRYELGGSISSNYYLGDIGRKGVIAPQSLGIALELHRPLSLRWTLMSQLALRGLRGQADYAANAFPQGVEVSRSFQRTLVDLSFGGAFHFFPYGEEARYLGTRSWTPFVGGGVGLAGGVSAHRLQLFPGVYLSAGLKCRLSDRWRTPSPWMEGVASRGTTAMPLGRSGCTTASHHGVSTAVTKRYAIFVGS